MYISTKKKSFGHFLEGAKSKNSDSVNHFLFITL